MEPKFRVWLEKDGKYIIGEKESRILEGIQRYGSIMSAARSAGITYAHAWNLVEELARSMGTPIVVARRGGETGGGTVLTKAGEEILARYLQLEEGVATFLGTKKGRVFPEVEKADLVIVGSSCPGLGIISRLMGGHSVEIAEVGSTVGIAAVMLGEADLAGIHIYDGGSGSYNLPLLKRLWPPRTAVLIKGYLREQGFMVRKGNPEGLWSLRDIVEKGATIVNRNLGSGTRDLLERLMRLEGIRADEVKGYNHEVRTHEDVARAVRDGKADIGIGIRAVAELQGLDFLKLCDEEFDFVCERRKLRKTGVQKFIEVLKSGEFRSGLEAVPGMQCTPRTGDLVEITG